MQRIAGALANGFSFPLRHRRHDRDHKRAGGRAGIERLGNGDQRHFSLLEPLQKLPEVLYAPREPVQLGHDHGLYTAPAKVSILLGMCERDVLDLESARIRSKGGL